MKSIINTTTILLLFLFVFSASAQENDRFFKAAGTPVNPKVQAQWNTYYTYAGILDLCNRLAEAHPGLVKMESAGKSYQGRDMIVLTVTNLKNQDPDHKPGYYIDGNIKRQKIQEKG